jgi:nicotinamide-nucleotide amidase
VCKRLHTDFAIATSGIAGPDGGTPEQPVGTIGIAYGSPDDIRTKKYEFKGNRKQNIELSSLMALERFRRFLVEQG